MTEVIMTRAEARTQGLKRYFGRPCKLGHSGERFIDGTCVSCKLAANRRWSSDNKDKIAPTRKRWRRSNADHLQVYAKEYRKEWYAKNRETVLAKSKDYAKRNPEIARAATRRWQAKNPEKAKAYAANWYADPSNAAAHRNVRRSRKAQAGGAHTAAEIKALLTTQDHRCAYCRANLRKVKKHLDHIKPLALGGSNDIANLQWLCAPCNLRKGAKHPVQFAQEIGLLL